MKNEFEVTREASTQTSAERDASEQLKRIHEQMRTGEVVAYALVIVRSDGSDVSAYGETVELSEGLFGLLTDALRAAAAAEEAKEQSH